MNNANQIKILKNGQEAEDVKRNVRLGLLVFFIIGLSFFLVGINGFLSSMAIYRLRCTHSAGYCEVAQYSLLQSDFIVKNKIPINTIQEIYMDKRRGEKNYTYRMFLRTTSGTMPIETMYTNMDKSKRESHMYVFQNWKNNRGGNMFVYQESRGKAWGMLIFAVIGGGILWLFVRMYLLHRKEKKQKEINNPTRSENTIERM